MASDKPRLLLVAAALDPRSGSENGKGWIWTKALAHFYQLEILTLPHYAARIDPAELPPGCRIHAAGDDFSGASMLRYYREYARWCRQVIPVAQRLAADQPCVGLHHVTLGSLRVLPRYDRLGLPFTLGPLGGGECIPWSLLPKLRLPASKVLVEAARAPLNAALILQPQLRAVLRTAALTMATTPESAALLQKMGARKTAVVFPDAVDAGDNAEEVMHRREAQAPAIGQAFRCVCASRALWWKGIHLAIDFIGELRGRGVPATLEVYADGPDLEDMRKRAARSNLRDWVHFKGLVTREELLRAYGSCHLFVNPTMHDSASSALLEAYGTGLPSMTLGLGGAATVTTPQTGLNDRVQRIDEWLEKGCETVANWIATPSKWLETCRAAKARTLDFGPGHPQESVRKYLAPVFEKREG